jgi:metal-responsive CopG/Arc/MetJ family transcriptional regulator
MKTIAISIDEATLTGLDRLARSAERMGRSGSGSGRREEGGNRSRIVRQAIQEFLQRREGLQRDEREKKVYAKHRRLVTRQAEAVVGEQAEP